jgi:hypothetical protein
MYVSQEGTVGPTPSSIRSETGNRTWNWNRRLETEGEQDKYLCGIYIPGEGGLRLEGGDGSRGRRAGSILRLKLQLPFSEQVFVGSQ